MRFCPPDTKEDALNVLGLGSVTEITVSDLLSHLGSLGLKYEEAKEDNIVHKCDDAVPVPNAQSYKVYAGVDASKKFARNFLVVADESGVVRYIEARHAYQAPSFSN